MSEITLINGTVLTPDGAVSADVVIDGDTVAAVGSDGERRGEVLDCAGAYVGPGFVDVHVHFREPGLEWKEDIASGSAAAAAGGFTAVVTMPNTDPAIDSGHLARYILDRGREVGFVEVVPAGAITLGRAGSALAHLDELWNAGVRIFSDDGDAVADAGLLRMAMEYLADRGGVIAEHAEDAGLTRDGHMHEGSVSSRLGMGGMPALAEETIVARDLRLVELTGCRYHVQHVSTAGTVELVRRAKAAGMPVTAEATPHHLTLDHRAVESMDPAYKMYPPLRTPDDLEAVREALRDGVIDLVATDHAPHAAHEKDVPFEHAPRGIIGLETAAALVAPLLDTQTLFDRLSVAPARLAGLERHGWWIEPGAPANLVVFDPDTSWTVQRFRSKSENSPYLGSELTGAVRYTIFEGAVTHR